jgi:ABC-type Fe3+ transport system permease subunit
MAADPRRVTSSPSRVTARLLAVVSLALPIALPAAVVYARRARREAAASPDEFSRPRRLIDRPLIFYVVVWVLFLSLMFVLMGILSVVFDVSPV